MIIGNQCNDLSLKEDAISECKKFEELFTLYGKCHDVFNSAYYLSDKEIDLLGMYI